MSEEVKNMNETKPETATEETAAPVETMADYEDAINASLKPIHEGDILTGEVIGVSEDTVTLDLGSFTDGIIRLEDASDDPNFTFNEIQVGQTISATVIRRDDGEGHILLSMKEAAAVLGWERLEQLLKDQSNITVKISEAVKSGVVAYVEGIRGFIPASKLALEYVENPEDWVGKEIEVRVITADPEDKKLVLSAKEILREKEAEERKQRVSNVEVGLVTEGTVESLMPYGAFVRLSNDLTGLVHVSQICQQRIKHPGVVLKEGQTVKVKVIGIKDGKISLSMKALEDVAAVEVEEETYEMPETEAATAFACPDASPGPLADKWLPATDLPQTRTCLRPFLPPDDLPLPGSYTALLPIDTPFYCKNPFLHRSAALPSLSILVLTPCSFPKSLTLFYIQIWFRTLATWAQVTVLL